MRCLFCKQDSSLSRSVEHIIPESLGGLSHTLPSGVVCDRCNNYFSHSVEKPFLESEAIELLRFNEVVVSKKGRVPPVRGILSPGHFPVTLYRNLRADPEMLLDIPPEAVHDVLQLKSGAIILPSEAQFPSGLLVSRFLAKVALEAMAQKLVLHPDGLEYLVDEIQLDPIRNHARRGDIQDWPVHIRRIYPSREKWTDESNREVQVVNEFDILTTVKNEWYFVLALFGTELVINYGGPETEGYQQWLDEDNGASPLYSGKNSNDFRLRRSS